MNDLFPFFALCISSFAAVTAAEFSVHMIFHYIDPVMCGEKPSFRDAARTYSFGFMCAAFLATDRTA